MEPHPGSGLRGAGCEGDPLVDARRARRQADNRSTIARQVWAAAFWSLARAAPHSV